MSEEKDAPTLAEQAENLRLEGNDAFGTKDWDRALKLYRDSVATKESAKTYSNLAATLCKLSMYSEAREAADRATILEPQWAKGWWRRGVVEELLKNFPQAYNFYSISVDLEPGEQTFVSAQKMVKKRLNIRKEGNQIVMDTLNPIDAEKGAKEPSAVAWRRFCANNPENLLEVYVPRQTNFPTGENPTSEQYLNQGLHGWSIGLRDSVARLTCSLVPRVNTQYEDLLRRMVAQHGQAAPQILDPMLRRMLGGNPASNSLQPLSNAFSHLGGLSIPLQHSGPNSREQTANSLCPQPAEISFFVPYQLTAILLSVHAELNQALLTFGKGVKVLTAILDASHTLTTNLRSAKIKGVQSASSREVVDYIKLLISSGHSWDGGIRRFVAMLYRGSILYGGTLRLLGQVAACYEVETAAREFITLADEEFNVSAEGAYDEKGTTFRESFQIGMLLSELQSLLTLQTGSNLFQPGPFSIQSSIDFCVKIIEMANSLEVPRNFGQPEYCFVQNDVAFRRKPLAIAHSTLAKQLHELQSRVSPKEWDEMTLHYGFRTNEDDNKTPNAIIAEHYQLAAEAELHDAEDQAIFWWACASFIARSSPLAPNDVNSVEGLHYCLGDLRSAVAKALKAEGDRDIGLFGPNTFRGSMNETIAKVVVSHYQDKPDSFRLPHILLVERNKVISLEVGDKSICNDLEKTKDVDVSSDWQKALETLMDTLDLEKEHGTEINHGVPSLEILCIRQLHQQGCEHAIGETDGAVIQYKALAAGWQGLSAK